MNDKFRLASGMLAAITVLAGVGGVIHATLPPGPAPAAATRLLNRDVSMVERSADTPTCDNPFTKAAVRTLLQGSVRATIVGLTSAAPDPVRTNATVQVCRATVVTAAGPVRARYDLRRAPGGPGWRLSARLI